MHAHPTASEPFDTAQIKRDTLKDASWIDRNGVQMGP
jgi:hypothetical protein